MYKSVVSSVNIAKARSDFSEIINKAAFAKERILLKRHNKNVAAVVSIEDYQLLAFLEESGFLNNLKKQIKEKSAQP